MGVCITPHLFGDSAKIKVLIRHKLFILTYATLTHELPVTAE